MKLLIINGPNLNMLGIREPHIYGVQTFADLENFVLDVCHENDIDCELYQSYHEGCIVDRIQQAYGNTDGIVINPAAYTHTSIAILDALKAVGIPSVEVHLSDVHNREAFRNISYPSMVCVNTFTAEGFESYRKAILFLKEYLDPK